MEFVFSMTIQKYSVLQISYDVTENVVNEVVFCRSSPLQALAQEVSDFVSSVKVKMTEDGTMAALRTVMKLCTLSASPEAQVRHQPAVVTGHSYVILCFLLNSCLLGC